jgi:hypothetical protein
MITSKMKALIDPGRYGLTAIDQIWGVYRPRLQQRLVIEGDLVKDSRGQVFRFSHQQNGKVSLQRV